MRIVLFLLLILPVMGAGVRLHACDVMGICIMHSGDLALSIGTVNGKSGGPNYYWPVRAGTGEYDVS